MDENKLPPDVSIINPGPPFPDTHVNEDDPSRLNMMAAYLSWLGVGPGTPHEVRILPADGRGPILIGIFDNPWNAAIALQNYDGVGHVLVSLQEVKGEVRGRADGVMVTAQSASRLPPGVNRNTAPVAASDEDIVAIDTILIDIDPTRAPGFTDACSTHAELRAALTVRDHVVEDFVAATGQHPVSGISGNGGLIVFKLQEPLATSEAPRVKRLLEAIAKRFDTDGVKIDTKVYNPSRLTRVAGTMNVKLEAMDRLRRRAWVEQWDSGPVSLLDLEKWLDLPAWTSGAVRSSAVTPAQPSARWPSDEEYGVVLKAHIQATKDHRRQLFVLALAGALRKSGWPEGQVIAVVQQLCADANDNEVSQRLGAVKSTFAKPMDDITGWPAMLDFGLERKDLPLLAAGGSTSGSSGKDTMAARLVELVEEQAELFHDERSAPFARIKNKYGAHEMMKIRSRSFRSWLSAQLYDIEGRVPTGEALGGASSVLEAKALRGEKIQLWNRVARGLDGAIWLDLGDRRGRAIRVTAEGWSIVENPPALFHRFTHQQSLPDPAPPGTGNPWRLLDLVKIPNWHEKLLFVVSTVVALIPDIPQPILMMLGQQGAAKTTAAKMRRRLVDPSVTATIVLRRDTNELAQVCAHHYMPLFDNVSTLTEGQTDLLCQVATGGAVTRRELYSDEDDVIMHFLRPVILTAITMPKMKGDLPDRSLMLRLERISPDERREEREVWLEFERLQPEILGGLLDALVGAMRIQPTLVLPALTRMADAARWGTAAAIAMKVQQDDFLNALAANSLQQSAEFADADSLAWAVREFAFNVGRWMGTATSLLVELNQVPGVATSSREWPKNASELGAKLKPLIPMLADLGVRVTHGRQGGGNRDKYWLIEVIQPSTV